MTLGQGLVLAVGAIVLVLLVPRPARRTPRTGRVRRTARLRLARASRPTTPDLAAIDRLLALAVSSAEDEHVRLRPLVLDIARQRLADHTGVRIDTAPEAAAALLGPETWELVRPDRPRPDDRRARGTSPEGLRAVIESLERIGAPG
jgi:hypothetical protein